jgi:hypothetical protein
MPARGSQKTRQHEACEEEEGGKRVGEQEEILFKCIVE